MQSIGPSLNTERPRQTLTELVSLSKDWSLEHTEIPLAGDYEFSAEGLRHGGEMFRLSSRSRKRLFDGLKAPASYLAKLSPEVQAAILSEHARLGHRRAKGSGIEGFGNCPIAVVKGPDLETIVPGELIRLEEHTVVRAAADALGSEADALFVTRIVRNFDRFEVELASPTKAVTVRAGDIVQAGISIIHRRYGTEATHIQSFIHRLVCENGMVRRECPSRDGLARTRRLDATKPGEMDTQVDQIRRLTQQTWEGLQVQLDEFRATSERKAIDFRII